MNIGNRSLISAAAVFVVLVGVAGFVVVADRGVSELDPESPEGVVQSYVQAILDDEHEVALALLESPSPECPRTDPEEFRMTLSEVSVSGDRAEVEVAITRGGGESPFDGYSYVADDTFELRRGNDGWLITEVPWRFEICKDSI